MTKPFALKIPKGALLCMSFSVYNNWVNGRMNEAYAGVRGIEIEPTEAMIRGKELHKEWEEEALKTGKVAKIFGLDIDVEAVEVRKTQTFERWWRLAGVADVLTKDSVIDYKTSTSKTASEFMHTGQLEIYAYLFQKPIGEILCYNPKTGAVSRARKHISFTEINKIIERIGSAAYDLRAGLESQGLPWWRTYIAEPADKSVK